MASPPSLPSAADGAEVLRARRWRLIRDLVVFAGKAALEAFRDLALIPVGLVAGLAGLLFHPRDPEFLFREVLRLGDRFDRFVDLFGADRARPRGEALRAEPSFDALVGRVERVLVEQHRRGGVTAQAKEAVDRALDTLQRRPGNGPADDSSHP